MAPKLPVTWRTLDDADNDAIRFLGYAVAALTRVQHGLGARAADQLIGGGVHLDTGLVRLVHELHAVEAPFAFVLDAYHVIHEPTVHRAVDFVQRNLPPRARLLITRRAQPPFALGQLRAQWKLIELGPEQLRFEDGEARCFMADTLELDLPTDVVDTMNARAEGWIAGLQPAGLSLRQHDDPRAFVERFSGQHSHVLDYLRDEVLDRQPPATRAFLLRTSILERLSGELCETFAGVDDGAAMLEALHEAHLFLLPLDAERRWWRYHRLFADALRARPEEEVQDEQLPRRSAPRTRSLRFSAPW